MRILFLDTETNGLPLHRHAPPSDSNVWPAIVQIAWQVWDMRKDPSIEPVLLQSTSLLIKPEADTVWNAESEAIHRISRAQAENEGVPAANAIRLLARDASECAIVVIHNLAFDKPVVWSAAMRVGDLQPETWWPRSELCFMLAMAPVCRIPSKWPGDASYKWPRLNEVWSYVFPEQSLPADLHDAAADVACLVKCFQELHRRRVLDLPDIPVDSADRFVDLFRRVLSILHL